MIVHWTMARVLLRLVPEHGRTSCSDERPVNWYTTDGRGGHPRCTRCALLHAIENQAWPYADDSPGVQVELSIRYEGRS